MYQTHRLICYNKSNRGEFDRRKEAGKRENPEPSRMEREEIVLVRYGNMEKYGKWQFSINLPPFHIIVP